MLLRTQTPLLGFIKDRPSTDIDITRPLPLGRNRASVWRYQLHTRSVLVVPPDLDGFLRGESRRFIAPCSRSWGSPSSATVPKHYRLPSAPQPFEALPSMQPGHVTRVAPVHRGSYPLAVAVNRLACFHAIRPSATSGPFSASKAAAHSKMLPSPNEPHAPLGFD